MAPKYRLEHKKIGELHVYTSPDVPGLFVADADKSVALGRVPHYVETLAQINARREERDQVHKLFA